jgi:subfamily B ATP-binding cassette protein MsbA
MLIGIVRGIALYLYQWAQSSVALTVAKNTRQGMFKALLKHDYSSLSRKSAAHWMSVIMNDVLYLQMNFSEIMTVLLKDSVLVISCLIAMSFIHWQTGLVLLLVCPFIAFGLGRAGQRIRHYANFWQRELGKIAAFVLDIRQRFVFIRAQGGEERELGRFEDRNENYYRSIRRSILLRSAFAPAIEWVGFALFAGFVYVVAKGQWGRDFSSATMLQFFAALGLLVKPLKEMGEQMARLSEIQGSMAACKAVLDQGSEFPSSVDSEAPSNWGRWGIGEIAVSYGETPAVIARNLQFGPAKSVAIVGPSGGGKSSLIKALCGLVQATSWHGDVTQNQMAFATSLVSQRPFLFKDTVRANLVYGLALVPPDAEIREQMIGLGLGMIELGDEFDPIAQNLSGGQIQRLVILRALLRTRSVLVLDEATSALDTEIEMQIVGDLLTKIKQQQSMLIMVTHRLSYLSKFDEVWFVENGELVAQGQHEDLLSQRRYAEYVYAGME